MFRGDPRCQLLGMPKPPPSIECQGEGERTADIVGIGWRERSGFVWHGTTLCDAPEQSKNIISVPACHSRLDSVMLATCQTTISARWNGSSGKPIRPRHGSRTPSRCWRPDHNPYHLLRLVTDDGADPYLVLGVLVEGAVHTLAKHIPRERQPETTEQLGQLLVERLKAHGLA